MRMFFTFLVIWWGISALIFGYSFLTIKDVKITAKLILAAIIAAIFSTAIFFLEYN